MRIHQVQAAGKDEVSVVVTRTQLRAKAWIRSVGMPGGMWAACVLFFGGCGANDGAGSVNMSSIKSVAKERGFAEGKDPDGAKPGNSRSAGRNRRLSPGKPLVKNGR
ncbi:hypothetical protein ACYOEI_15600 [Singulisphaera rosea]